MEARKKWSIVRDWEQSNKLADAKELVTWDLANVRELLHETSKTLEIEGQLLRKFLKNRALRLERSCIVSLVKITEFWMGNKIKRGEALEHLERVLSRYEPFKDVDLKIIPELTRAIELRNELRKEKINFTKDDFYLTIDEMFEKQYKFYHQIFSNPSEAIKRYWKDYQDMKEEVEARAVHKGSKIIHFSLPDENGKMVSTQELLKDGPLVLSFFRGSWCPFCIQEICVLADSIPRFEAMGAKLVSVGADVHALKYFRKLGVVGDILFDDGMKISRMYNLVYKMSASMVELNRQYGFDVSQWNGGCGDYLPVPATYIINRRGEITFDFVSMEYYRRLDPRVIVEELYKIFEDDLVNDSQEGTILGKRKLEEDPSTSSSSTVEQHQLSLGAPERKKVKTFDLGEFIKKNFKE